MAYEKINWTEQIPLNPSNLNHMETQYDEALSYAAEVRASSSLALCAEVVSSFPSHAAGRLILHTGEDKGYYSTGTNWVTAFVKAEGVS